MDNNDFETVYIKEEISRCEDIDELKERIFPMIKSQQEQWAIKFKEIIGESELNKSRFADRCGVSRGTVNKWCNGSIPKNRETFLRIGMVAGFSREQMDQLLQRYGQYPALYSKSLEDCVCIYVLGKGYGEETLTKYNYILNKIKENIIQSDGGTKDISTLSFDEKLSDVKSEDELETFISDNSAVFAMAYHKFYAYVKMHIMANGTVADLADTQEWTSSLKHSVYAIRQGKWYPTRNKIISLGLHLSMDHGQIDEMMELAHMEPLCAKNAFESIIMFILDDASLNNMLDQDVYGYNPDSLYTYARKVLKEFDLPEIDSFITELAEIDSYVQ